MQRFDPPANGRQSPIPAFGPPEAADPSPGSDAAMEEHEAVCPGAPGALLARLQDWAQRVKRGASLQTTADALPKPAAVRFHYRIRCPAPVPVARTTIPEVGSVASPGQVAAEAAVPLRVAGDLFDRQALGEALASLSPPLPPPWGDALVRGWPYRLDGLHRIELEPGAVWVSVEIGLQRKREVRLQARRQALQNASKQAPQPALQQASSPALRDAVVVGAGLAGCAMADALARRGWRVVVVEAGDHVGGAVADVPLLAQHPALSPGADRRSRLLLAALLASERHADRFGTAMKRCGRFQPMPIDEARVRTAGLPPSVAEPVVRSTVAGHGVDGLPGIWFPTCAVVDPQQWWCRVLQSPRVALLLSRPVAAIERHAQCWRAFDANGELIAAAPLMVLANQANALQLAALPAEAAGSLRLSRIQVAIGSGAASDGAASEAASKATSGGRRAAILGGSSYRLEDPGRCCIIGPLQPGRDSLARHDIDLPSPTIGDLPYHWRISEPGERLLMRDNLPMIGAVPDVPAIQAQRRRFERNDRLPLPRRDSLHLLAGLGGRGLLWSMIGAEMIAAAALGEPPVVEPELEEAVDPARFLKRSLRRAPGQADGMKVLSS
jgi:tRNA U-34 5-methylaminomethyl-2-thiouridine biosynthesis protein MnmC